jgi:hypothetical protein
VRRVTGGGAPERRDGTMCVPRGTDPPIIISAGSRRRFEKYETGTSGEGGAAWG